MTELWNVKHPYYCADQLRDRHICYESWEEFLELDNESDLDLALLVRWDWQAGDDDEGDQLHLFFVLQREGGMRSVHVDVSPDDEPSIRAWLAPRWERMMQLWAPFPTEEAP